MACRQRQGQDLYLYMFNVCFILKSFCGSILRLCGGLGSILTRSPPASQMMIPDVSPHGFTSIVIGLVVDRTGTKRLRDWLGLIQVLVRCLNPPTGCPTARFRTSPTSHSPVFKSNGNQPATRSGCGIGLVSGQRLGRLGTSRLWN